MAIKEERIDELIAVYKNHYQMDISRDEARQICERIAQLFEALKRSKLPSPYDSTEAMRS
jgi:hypothetical protein